LQEAQWREMEEPGISDHCWVQGFGMESSKGRRLIGAAPERLEIIVEPTWNVWVDIVVGLCVCL
jgi:hypothetical protein